MHNIDRTNPEWGDSSEYETFDEFEGEFDNEHEWESEMFEAESPFSEADEFELASELLEVTSDEELDYFLGKVLKKAASAAGRFVKGPVGKALGGVLKKVAKTALPMAGAALGNLVVPGIGGVVGGKLASAAGSMFGLELEGLSPEDREFEVARRVVRLAGAAAVKAAKAPPQAPPSAVAVKAVKSAARRHAPGLASTPMTASPLTSASPYGGRSGRWFRRGRRIVLLGV